MSPGDNRAGWLAGVPLLLIACLIPPFVLFAPIALALAALAGLVVPDHVVPPAAVLDGRTSTAAGWGSEGAGRAVIPRSILF